MDDIANFKSMAYNIQRRCIMDGKESTPKVTEQCAFKRIKAMADEDDGTEQPNWLYEEYIELNGCKLIDK